MVRSAQWLIWAIERRRETIVMVTRCIVDEQRGFFDGRVQQIEPMSLTDVADSVDMHESTVARAVRSKYVHTTHGILPLEVFFRSTNV